MIESQNRLPDDNRHLVRRRKLIRRACQPHVAPVGYLGESVSTLGTTVFPAVAPRGRLGCHTFVPLPITSVLALSTTMSNTTTFVHESLHFASNTFADKMDFVPQELQLPLVVAV